MTKQKITMEELMQKLNEIVNENGYGQITEITLHQRCSYTNSIKINLPIDLGKI